MRSCVITHCRIMTFGLINLRVNSLPSFNFSSSRWRHSPLTGEFISKILRRENILVSFPSSRNWGRRCILIRLNLRTKMLSRSQIVTFDAKHRCITFVSIMLLSSFTKSQWFLLSVDPETVTLTDFKNWPLSISRVILIAPHRNEVTLWLHI